MNDTENAGGAPAPIDGDSIELGITTLSNDSSPTQGQQNVEAAQGKKSATTTALDNEPWRPAVDLSEKQTKLVILAIILTLASVYLDTFILAPALPEIARQLSATNAEYAWIASASLLTISVSVPIFAKVSDIFGRRNVMISANGVFLLGTFVSGFADSAAMLISGRLVLGIGCGGLVVVANVCVIDLVRPRNRGIYFSALAIVSGIASAVGPILGGVLSTKATWRWCFWINIPMTFVSFAVLIVFLKLPKPGGSSRQELKDIDWLGACTLTSATALILVGLQLGGTTSSWASATVISPIAVGVVVFGAFVWIEKKVAKLPLIPLPIFADMSRAATSLVMITQSMTSGAGKNFLVLYYQLVLGVDPIESSIYFLPFAITLSVVLPFTGWSIKKTGKYKWLIRAGTCILTLASGLLIDTRSMTNWPLIISPQILLAVGVALTYQSTTIAFQAQIKRTEGTAGQSALQLLRSFSQVIGIVLGQAIFQAQVSSRIRRLDDSQLDQHFIDQLLSGNTFTALSLIRRVGPHQVALIRQLLASSFQTMWAFYAAVCFCVLLVSFGITDVEML